MHSGISTSPSGTPQRWKVMRATFLTYFYDSYDLAILSVAMPALIIALGIDLTIGGFLHSATMIGAAIGSILIGIIAENYGRKLAIIISLIEFGIGTLLIYFIDDWISWAILRFLTGIGVGGVWGPCVSLVAAHWNPRYMARANAFMLSTFAIGWIAASFLGRFILQYDWRVLFLLGGTSILVAGYVWIAIPNDKKNINELDITGSQQKISLSILFNQENRKTTFLATLLNVCQMGGFWGAGAWIPTFLVKERGLEMGNMASFLVLMYIGVFLGYQLFGYIADKLGRRKAILLCFILDCLTVPCYLIINNAIFLFYFGPIMGLGFGGVFGVTGSFYAELFDEKIRALASGFCFNVGRLGAVIAPFTVGIIGQKLGLVYGIITSPVIFFIGILVTLLLPETLNKNDLK